MSKLNANENFGVDLTQVKADLFGELEQTLTGDSFAFASC